VKPARASTGIASLSLASIAALHVLWATGSHWPSTNAGDAADSISGRATSPGPAACLAVAGLLSVAAALVAGRPRRFPAAQRLGSAGVIGVLTLRGSLGLAGRTDLVSPGSTSARFRSLDRRVYSPLCLSLAALSLPALARESQT
jgi:hypothetical protein